jgi:hypothetical protein
MKKTTFRIEMREAVGNNAAKVLNLDGDCPGRIYAWEMSTWLLILSDGSIVI